MINKIKSTSTDVSKNYPKEVSWEYDGVPNSVICHSSTIWDRLIEKLVNAQVKPEPKILREIKYIKAKR